MHAASGECDSLVATVASGTAGGVASYEDELGLSYSSTDTLSYLRAGLAAVRVVTGGGRRGGGARENPPPLDTAGGLEYAVSGFSSTCGVS